MFLRKYLILIIFFFIDVSFADQYTAKVIRVIDGDTIWVKSDNKHIKIRLSYIDAPELKQIYGIRSRDFLINLVLEKNVQINTSKKDRYNRHLGEVYVHNEKESIFVNAKMIKSGNAWVYKIYRNNEYLINLENFARSNNKGLWSQKYILEPWKYRENR
jgi:endonuclease YncB( thermonuclease family)